MSEQSAQEADSSSAPSSPHTPATSSTKEPPSPRPLTQLGANAYGQTGVKAPWRGVNLGGWLLLEPGPAKALFSRHLLPGGVEATCEWDLMEVLHRDRCVEEIELHRRTYIGKADFEQIRSCGLNAIRLPFGYWTVLGPAAGEPYVGPALEYIDKAVDWAEEYGLQVVLDLHGAPGGESGDAPCGRRQELPKQWQWTDWHFDASLCALDTLAKRYCGRSHVTGIEVCNEPSSSVPTQALCRFYAQAVETIRAAGMEEDRVAIVLPIFQRPKANFAKAWQAFTGGLYKNVAFDFHYYHCFGSQWDGSTLAQQLRAVERHASELRRFPAVVGEWSLALGRAAREGGLLDEETRALFGRLQLEAYSQASHGWFFWNWKDSHSMEWNWQQSFKEGALVGAAPVLPPWDGRGEDPLEEALEPSPPERDICVGDTITLRSYNGYHIALSQCGLTLRSETGHDRSVACRTGRRREAHFTICSHSLAPGSPVLDGSTVRLRTSAGSYLAVDRENGRVSARHFAEDHEDAAAVFITHVVDSGPLRHRGTAYFQSLATLNMVHVDGGLHALWDHCGDWQRFVVEKRSSQPQGTDPQTPQRSPSLLPRALADDLAATPIKLPSLTSKRDSMMWPLPRPIKRARNQVGFEALAPPNPLEADKACPARSRSRSRSRSAASTVCPDSTSEVSFAILSPTE